MKLNDLRRSVLVLAAMFGAVDFAYSAELIGDATVLGPPPPAAKVQRHRVRGLLASRASAPPAANSDSAPLEQEAPAPGGQAPVQPASWNHSLLNHETASLDTTLTGSGLGSECDSCTSCDCCPDPLWIHRSGVFADLLYLRPGNIDYVYAVEQTGPLPTDSPTGPTGRVGFDAAMGYRLGLNHAISDCTSIQASYTWFQTGTSDTINATPGTVLIFQPGVPAIPNVGASSIQASATYDIRFQQLDVDYRGLLYGTCDSAVNYFAGLRYANLDQELRAQEDIGVPVGLAAVNTDISFDGFGIGMGLDAMRRSAYSGMLIYGRGSASFVAGEFKADYRETLQFIPGAALGNSLEDYRVVTILQTELGLGWQSQCGAFRATAGYQIAGWFNCLTTGTYIAGVQTRQFDELWETISLDGFVGRLEWRF